MSEGRKTAEGCLIAICAHLSLSILRPVDFDMWLGVLGEVAAAAEGCSGPMERLRWAALDLVAARTPAGQSRALDMLRVETKRHYRLAAAQRYEAYRKGRAA